MRIRGIAASTNAAAGAPYAAAHGALHRTLPVAGSTPGTATARRRRAEHTGDGTSVAGPSDAHERRVDQMLGQGPALQLSGTDDLRDEHVVGSVVA